MFGRQSFQFDVAQRRQERQHCTGEVVLHGSDRNGNASNTVTMAINNNRQPCSDASPFSSTSRSGGKNASIALARLSYTDPTNALKIGNGTVDIAMRSEER